MAHGIVLVTAKDNDEAEKIARRLLEKRLAACCNLIRDIRSFYWWQGKVEASSEVLMVIKTRTPLFQALKAEVKACHSYKVPEIILLPITDGSDHYLKWITEMTQV